MSDALAIDGGLPVRRKPLGYGAQWIEEDDIEAVAETLRSDFITCGPKIDELEEKLTALTGAKHAVAVNSGTAALHTACAVFGIGEGDEVITTPLTFMASANCALYTGARPVFADVDPETYQIDPASIEEKITPKTKAVVAVDYAGELVDVDRIRALCDARHIIFLEDAAHAIGSKWDGKICGSYADATCLSFHPVKTVTSGEGGALLTNDDTAAKKARLFRSHGMEHDPAEMVETPDGAWYYEQAFLGYNYRMPDINAALLISQLKKIDRFIARRKEIVRRYDEAFRDLPQIFLQKSYPLSDAARHLYVIRLNPDALTCDRKTFFDALRAENIYCQVHYAPTYRFPHYRRLGYGERLCPNAENVYAQIMSIPLFPKMTDHDVEDVVCAVKKVASAFAR